MDTRPHVHVHMSTVLNAEAGPVNVDDVIAEKIAAARARAEANKRRRAALAANRQRGLALRHAQRLRNQASARATDGTVTDTVTADTTEEN
ncbi:hypothetical protein [Streptomyces tibetensis]|uniref:hypothetical protein n=1 Tax=Streptomyces tibetensis TaxID=2382123 RepID=UPI0033C442DA